MRHDPLLERSDSLDELSEGTTFAHFGAEIESSTSSWIPSHGFDVKHIAGWDERHRYT